MRAIHFFLLFTLAALVLSSCKKNQDGSLPGNEAPLTFVIDPDPGSSVVPSLSVAYTYKIKITSQLPAGGVSLDLSTRVEATDELTHAQNLSSSVPTLVASTGDLTPGVLYKVIVKVTSKDQSTNSATKQFLVARK